MAIGCNFCNKSFPGKGPMNAHLKKYLPELGSITKRGRSTHPTSIIREAIRLLPHTKPLTARPTNKDERRVLQEFATHMWTALDTDQDIKAWNSRTCDDLDNDWWMREVSEAVSIAATEDRELAELVDAVFGKAFAMAEASDGEDDGVAVKIEDEEGSLQKTVSNTNANYSKHVTNTTGASIVNISQGKKPSYVTRTGAVKSTIRARVSDSSSSSAAAREEIEISSDDDGEDPLFTLSVNVFKNAVVSVPVDFNTPLHKVIKASFAHPSNPLRAAVLGKVLWGHAPWEGEWTEATWAQVKKDMALCQPGSVVEVDMRAAGV